MKKRIIEKKRKAESAADELENQDAVAIKNFRKTLPEYRDQFDDQLLEFRQEEFFNLAPANKAVDTWHIETMAEYYNLKYPERGRITPIFIVEYPSQIESVAKKMREDFADKYPTKIVVTEIFCDRPNHSHPFILTRDKLISMRNDSMNNELHHDLAQALGLPLIKPRQTNESFQADNTSCHMMAIGILKDLDSEDVRSVCEFDNNYITLPKSLKYCQSREYLAEVLDEKTENEPVKKDGRTAYQYLIDNRIERPYPHAPKTRIQAKEVRLVDALKSSPSQSPRVAAEYALKKLSEEKINRDHS